MQSKVTFLGHVLSEEGISPEASNVDEVEKISTPSCASDVKSFLGMATFFRKFMPDFSVHAVPLFDLLKENKEFLWSDVCENSV